MIFHAFARILLNKFNETNARLFHDGHFLVLYQVRLDYRTSLSTQNSLHRTGDSPLCVVVHLLFEVATDEHDGEREAKIERSEQQEATEEIIVRGADLAHGLG